MKIEHTSIIRCKGVGTCSLHRGIRLIRIVGNISSFSISFNSMASPKALDHGDPKLGQTQRLGTERGQSSCIEPLVNNGTDGLQKENSFTLNRWLKESKKDEPFNLLPLANAPHLHHANGTTLAVNPCNGTSSLGNTCVGNAAKSEGNKETEL
ncbi:hypothetical protein GGI43DRAFT_417635 [Trichoderma evansii]